MTNIETTNQIAPDQIKPELTINTPVIQPVMAPKSPFLTNKIKLYLSIGLMVMFFIFFVILIFYIFRPLKYQKISFHDSSGKQLKTEITAEIPDGYRIGAGLTQKNSIQEHEGMLYKFDNSGIYPFWMKNMKFSLDVIWVNNTEVVDFEENLKVPYKDQDPESLRTYRPSANADKVIEVQAGFIKKFHITTGDKITLHDLK